MHGRKDPASVLADVFKHSEYKPYQKRVVELVMDGKDVLFVSATNSGKSLCYQLPAFCLPGVALVVTPLTALIDDQLGKIRDVGIGAAALHSGRVHGDEQLFHEFMAGNITAHGKLKILLLTPEAFHKGQRAETLRSAVQRLYGDGLLSLVVFDEVHCFREWGWSFRCSYLQFNQLRREMGLVLTPILCLTATISTAHGESTTRMLGMRNVETVTGELSRFNVATEVVQKTSNRVVNLAKHIVELCMGRFRGMLGLVYCTSPADCRKLRDMLVADFAKAGFGISIAIYHGDLSPEEKQEAQSRFMGDCVELLLATNAFGMGIDKPGTARIAKSCASIDQVPNTFFVHRS
jgi:RecQ family ATP-dependent DNA helicase